MRIHSELSYRQRINRVVAHVQANLGTTLDSDRLAEQAAMSRFHFHRVFAAMTGMTPQQYVLRERLSAAIGALRASAAPIGAIALDVGFESGAALAKALRREFGLSPRAAREALVDPRVGPGVATMARSTLRRSKTMLQPEIRDLPARQMLCATERGAKNNDMSEAAQRAYARLFPAVEALGVMPRTTDCLAVCPDEVTGADDPDARFIAALAFEGEPPDLRTQPGIELGHMEAGRWAVFRHVGPYNTLWQTWRAIYRDWVPATQPALRDAAPFELYVNDASKVAPADLITDIHVPIR